MIADILRMTRWELFKLRKRWMPWVLLAIAVGISQLFLWGFFIAYQNDDIISESSIGYSVENEDGEHEFLEFSCEAILDDRELDSLLVRLPEDQRADTRRFAELSREQCADQAQLKDWSREIFVLPASLANGLGFIQSIAVFAVTILAVSSMGVEYGWGTLRTALTRGTGRWQFLGAKTLSLVFIAVAGLLFLSFALAISSLIAAWLTLGDGRGLADFGEWSTVAAIFGKLVYACVPYVVLGLFFSVLTSSSGPAISLGMGYVVVELILVGVLSNLFDWFGTVSDYMLGPNVAAWMVDEGARVTVGDANLIGSAGARTAQSTAWLPRRDRIHRHPLRPDPPPLPPQGHRWRQGGVTPINRHPRPRSGPPRNTPNRRSGENRAPPNPSSPTPIGDLGDILQTVVAANAETQPSTRHPRPRSGTSTTYSKP